MPNDHGAEASYAQDPAAVARALDDIAGQIAESYPSASPERITAVLRERFERTSGAKVQQYRLVLAERETRIQLRLDERAARTPTPPPDVRTTAAAAPDVEEAAGRSVASSQGTHGVLEVVAGR